MRLFEHVWKLAQHGTLPGDSDEVRLKKSILILVSAIVAPLAILWGSIYVSLGYPISGAIPLSYAAITFAGMGYLFATKQFKFFRFSQLLLILLLPFLLQWSLGGFATGSAVMAWAFFSPLAAMLFAQREHSLRWLVAFVLLTAISGVIDPELSQRIHPLPELAIRLFFVLNMGMGFAAIYFVFHTFVRDREISHQAALEAKQALEKANIELHESQEIIRKLMLTDALTGIANRRQLDERLMIELDRVKRYGRPLSLIIADLDKFKAVNDTFGHETGDEVLKAAAETMARNIRGTDFLARYGGEEFVVLLPETDSGGAEVMAERLRMAIRDNTIFAIKKAISISLGVATSLQDETAKSLLKRADDALYMAKRSGRDQVRVAEAMAA